jgi:carbohydrate diacid regulator
MQTTSASFEQVAGQVSQKVAELLDTYVCVTDAQGIVVAASEPGCVGQRLGGLRREGNPAIPLRAAGQEGGVIVGEPLNGELVPPRLARGVVELVISQATVVSALPNQDVLKNTFIHDLLRGVLGDEEQLLRQARILGMDLAPPRAVILIDAANYILGPSKTKQPEENNERARRRAQLVIGSVVSFFCLPSDTICGYIGEGEIAVLKASDTKNLVHWAESDDLSRQPGSSWANLSALKRAGEALLSRLHLDTSTPFSVGIGRYHRGLDGLARSYEDARAALSLGRHFHGDNGVHCLDALGTAAFVGVSDERTKVELAKYLLSPLDGEPELINTLEALFAENCHPLQAAHRLGIHRNTLSYRLDKIALLTGMDPRCFEQAVQIRLALLLRSLQGDKDGAS